MAKDISSLVLPIEQLVLILDNLADPFRIDMRLSASDSDRPVPRGISGAGVAGYASTGRCRKARSRIVWYTARIR